MDGARVLEGLGGGTKAASPAAARADSAGTIGEGVAHGRNG